MTVVRRLWAIIRRNLAWKIVALLAATAFWVAINGSEPNADRYLRLVVRPFGLSQSLMVATDLSQRVDVQLRGPASILRTIDEDRHSIVIDLRGVTAGRLPVKIGPEMLNLPRRVRVVGINPPRIDLRIAQLQTKPVPVRVVLVPTRREGYTISDVVVIPATIDVSGPQGRMGHLKSVETEPINILNVIGEVEREVALTSAGEWFSYSPATVRVAFAVRETLGRRTFREVPVLIRDAKFPATVTPTKVELVLAGSERGLTALQLDSGTVQVNVANLGPGVHTIRPEVFVPDGFQVEGVTPSSVEVRLQVPSPAAGGGGKARDS
jgi:YbbR domain-containing protein